MKLVKSIQKNYEAKARKRNSRKGLIVGSLASGAVLGIIGGLLLAPEKGNATRKVIANKLSSLNIG